MTAPSPQQGVDYFTTAFLPWITHDSSIQIGDFLLAPLNEAHRNFFRGDFDDLKRILSGYLDVKGRPVNSPLIVGLSGSQKVNWDVPEQRFSDVAIAIDLLLLSAYSKNKYFSALGPYVNSAMFSIIWQRYQRPADGFALSARRREGRTMDMGYRHGQLKFSIPIQIRYPEKISFDDGFLRGLVKAYSSDAELAGRIRASVAVFRAANTDSNEYTPQQEVVWLASAFEYLLDAKAVAKDVGAKFAAAFGSFTSITFKEAAESQKRKTIKTPKPQEQDKTLSQVWAEDLYTVRGMAVHDSFPTKDDVLRWTVAEHLLLGTFLFPILVKILLASIEAYELTVEDTGTADSFERLLESDKWDHDESVHSNSLQSGWNDIISDAIFEQVFRGATRKSSS